MNIYSNVLKHIFLPIGDRVMKTSIAAWFKRIKAMRTWSKKNITEWQNVKLRKLVEHAYHNSIYYNKLFKSLGLKPQDILCIDDLAKLPILTKKSIRENFRDLVPSNIHSFPNMTTSTGGSGDPLIFLLDKNSWSFVNANNIFNWERLGYRYGQKYIALGSTSLYINKNVSMKHWFYYKLKRKIGLSGVNMSENVCRKYVDLIQKQKVLFIYGYAAAIFLLAKFVLQQKAEVNIKACFSTSEILTKEYRRTISEAFGCKIMDCYGAHDGAITAYSFEEGFFEVGYNCLVRLHDPNSKGIGGVLLTDLLNYAMPLINYHLGDELQIFQDKNRIYNFNGQVINAVLGRASDVIYLENGNVLTGVGFSMLFRDLPVEHFLIEKDGINSIKCHIKTLSEYGQYHEHVVRSTFMKHMGPDSLLSINYTDQIELTNSGKRVYFKN
jgi:phenylacetate-coenzyme A ligase PaaK-like adenylate-forming protein